MTGMQRFVGIDPGPVPGIVELAVMSGRLVATSVVQCTADVAPELVRSLLVSRPHDRVQIEQFVVGRRASRSSSASAGAATRDLIGRLEEVCAATSTPSLLRTAAQVKPWATDDRLVRADLWRKTAGMRHARDAARHALYAAVHEGALPDPLSKEWKR